MLALVEEAETYMIRRTSSFSAQLGVGDEEVNGSIGHSRLLLPLVSYISLLGSVAPCRLRKQLTQHSH